LHLETIEDKTIVMMEIFRGNRPPYFFKPEKLEPSLFFYKISLFCDILKEEPSSKEFL